MTPYEALRAVTKDTARQYFEEHRKGTLEPGKLADIVVMDRDPLAVEPMQLKGIEVLGSTRIDLARNPPYTFEIENDPDRIHERHSYSVRAKIVNGGKLLFTTDTNCPVLTRVPGIPSKSC